MKWYFVKIQMKAIEDIYVTEDSSRLGLAFPVAKFVNTPADAIGLRNTLTGIVKEAAEIWCIDTKKMKLEKLKL